MLLDAKITALSVNKYVPQSLKQTLQKSIMNFNFQKTVGLRGFLVVAFLNLESKEATTRNTSAFAG